MCPVVQVNQIPPRKSSTRSSKYPFSPQEIAQAHKLVTDKGIAGVGPHESIREARGAAQRLQRLLVEDGLEAGTTSVKGWEDNGKFFGAVKVRDEG